MSAPSQGKFTCAACPRCGGTERYVSSGACVACVAAYKRPYERKMRAELRRLRDLANPKPHGLKAVPAVRTSP